jgi:hypothetical protein
MPGYDCCGDDCFAACGRVRESVSLDPSNGSACRNRTGKRRIAAGHRNIPPNAILQIHVQKHFLGPQTRALVTV